jgi:hypothetical protein
MTVEFATPRLPPEKTRYQYEKPIEKKGPNGTGPAKQNRTPEVLKKHIKRT